MGGPMSHFWSAPVDRARGCERGGGPMTGPVRITLKHEGSEALGVKVKVGPGTIYQSGLDALADHTRSRFDLPPGPPAPLPVRLQAAINGAGMAGAVAPLPARHSRLRPPTPEVPKG